MTPKCGRKKTLGASHALSGEGSVWFERLEKYVASKKLNRSGTREKVLELALLEREHFSAQDLVRRASHKYPQLGSATIYRAIPVLLDAGILKETLSLQDGTKLFEISEGAHHDHIVCVDCGAIFEFHDPVIEKAQEKLEKKLRFKGVSHRHVIYANCEYLQEKT